MESRRRTSSGPRTNGRSRERSRSSWTWCSRAEAITIGVCRCAVPCAGRLKLSARILVAEGNTAHVGFGTNFVFPPTHHSGCGAVESFQADGGVEADRVRPGRPRAGVGCRRHGPPTFPRYVARRSGPCWTAGRSLSRGVAGQRVVVYLDDVRIEGEVPSQAGVRRRRPAALGERPGAIPGATRRLARTIAAGDEALAKTGDLTGPAGKTARSAREMASDAKS